MPVTTCAKLHQNRFVHFQNMVFTSLVTDERTKERTGWKHNVSASYAVWPSGGMKILRGSTGLPTNSRKVTSDHQHQTVL